MNSVFVPVDRGHDLTSAKKFGDLIVMCEDVSAFDLNEIQKQITECLDHNMITNDDLLLLSGPNSVNCMAALEISKRVEKINFLIFHARLGKYIRRDHAL